eukprot:03933.XXX_51434_52543_1 [CDS] Oithona nana genome sequencing.
MIEIDGSLLEGGGQVLRMSVALSALLRKPIRIFNIRGNRSKPGLRAQHMSGLKLVHQLTGGQLEGCQLHSTQIIYKPPPPPASKSDFNSRIDECNSRILEYEMDIGNNGAISLLVQICLPVALYRHQNTEFSLKGGTFGDFAPPMIYCQQVLVPLLKKHFGLSLNMQLLQESFDMKGGGHVKLEVQPLSSPLKPLNLDQPLQDSPKILVRSNVSGNAPLTLASKASKAAETVLQGLNYTINNEFLPDALGTAVTIFIKAELENTILAASKVSQKKNENPNKFGREVAEEIRQTLDLGVPVDQWMQDQLIIYMALASGCSRLLTGPLTLHTRTAISIAEQLTSAQFKVTTVEKNKRYVIECQGIGLSTTK